MADIITFPWIRNATDSSPRFAERGTIDLDDYPAVKRWYDEIAARPAVQRGLAVMAERLASNKDKPAGESWDVLFGQTQFEAR
jgi:GSH-dependent disulfide-bond oxidoreductase